LIDFNVADISLTDFILTKERKNKQISFNLIYFFGLSLSPWTILFIKGLLWIQYRKSKGHLFHRSDLSGSFKTWVPQTGS